MSVAQWGSSVTELEGETVNSKKIAVVTLLCAVIALAACRREEAYYPPLKLGGDVDQQDKK
jgi:hypothetical protein